MINIRALELAAVVAGISILCGSSQAQNALLVSMAAAQESGAQTEVTQAPKSIASTPTSASQRMARSTPRVLPQGKSISIDDLLTGITLSTEQKPKIEQVRKNMRDRMDQVVHDKNESVDQKQAMLQGLQRMELRDVYLLLTPDQRIEVKNKIAAQRAAEQQSRQALQESRSK